MSKTITLTEHRPADGLLTMRVRNTTYNVNIFFNPNAKSTLDTQMRKIIQKEAKAENRCGKGSRKSPAPAVRQGGTDPGRTEPVE